MQTALSFKKIPLSLQILFVRHNREERVTYCCLFMTKNTAVIADPFRTA